MLLDQHSLAGGKIADEKTRSHSENEQGHELMTSDDTPAQRWAQRLQDQGIDETRIADAEKAGANMATAADSLLFDPSVPIAPGKIVGLLVASAKARS